jgi:hypothetical protein
MGIKILFLAAALPLGSFVQNPPDAQSPSAGQMCIAVVLPEVEGVEGNATEVATGLQQLLISYLSGPSFRPIALEARLASQAAEEARQKNCDRVVSTKLTRKRGGGRLGKVFGDAASTAAWYMPGGATVGSAVVRGAAIAGAQAASTLAATTKAKDEMQIDYELLGRDGKAPDRKTEKAKAKVDGEDLLTPMARKVAETIAAAATSK